MTELLAIVFALSGGAGLVYESIWTRYLGLFVGHGAYAQVLVLVIFLGGMSAGAFLAGRRSERIGRPLAVYAGVEALAGLAGLLFHPLFRLVTDFALDRLFPSLGSPAAVVLAKWSLAALLILPQSVLLGATFPLMSAALLRRRENRSREGRVLSILYSSNSLGGAIGVLFAGFWLVERAGLPGTLVSAGVANLAIAAVAAAISIRSEGRSRRTLPEDRPGEPPPASLVAPLSAPLLRRLLVAVAFGTAVASFVYEIAWNRMLSLVLGSAAHSFELMLSAFILGLALGAWWMRKRADRLSRPLRTLGVVQWAMGGLALATLPLYAGSFRATVWMIDALAKTLPGWELFNVSRYALCLVIMLPATFCAGMTLPLITKILVGSGEGEGAVGLVYGANTLGSILGAGLGGLVLLPLLGLKWLLVAGSLVDAGLGVAIFALLPREGDEGAIGRHLPLLAAAGSLTIALGFGLGVPLEPAVLSSGVYRYGWIAPGDDTKIELYRDGRTATVAVRAEGESGIRTISTNGKPDASLRRSWFEPPSRFLPTLARDDSTQALMPLVLLARHPGAETAAVIGIGCGMSSHLLLGSPNLRRLWTVEIEPEMVRGARLFRPANHRVFDDPRSEIVIDDAKSHFAAAGRRYDLVLSEPSNPWVSGVAGLFTVEFYSRAKRYMAPGALFGQWIHLYEIDDELVLSVLAAVDRSFRSWDVWFVADWDLLIVASDRPSLPEPDWRVVGWPAIREDLSRFAPLAPDQLDAMRLGGRALFASLLERAVPPNSDDHPWLELGAERARFLRHSADGLKTLPSGPFDLAAALENRRKPMGVTGFPSLSGIPPSIERALGVRLRDAIGGRPIPLSDDELAKAFHRWRCLQTLALCGKPIDDWHPVVDLVLEVFRDLHSGSAGTADPKLFELLLRLSQDGKAPDPVRASFEFLQAIAGWDWESADAAARVLVPLAIQGEVWIPPELLRDGATVAAIRRGLPDRAAEVIAALEPKIPATTPPLRKMLLATHTIDLGENGSR
jgi:predicted membrane-bound spermidine synthase